MEALLHHPAVLRHDDARDLIRGGVERGGVWAEIGAGGGRFTAALAELVGADGRVIALDSDKRAVAKLAGLAASYGPFAPVVEVAHGDFHRLDDVRALRGLALDGFLMANALHFSKHAGDVLADAANRLREGGRIVVVEYDGRPASPWLPYPLGLERLTQLADGAGLSPPGKLGERPSEYHGSIYAALLVRKP